MGCASRGEVTEAGFSPGVRVPPAGGQVLRTGNTGEGGDWAGERWRQPQEL